MIVDRKNALKTHWIPEEVGYFSPKHIKKNLVYGNQMMGMFLIIHWQIRTIAKPGLWDACMLYSARGDN